VGDAQLVGPSVEIGCPQMSQRVTQRRQAAWQPYKRATTSRRSLNSGRFKSTSDKRAHAPGSLIN
jgi:hypothetical protein